MFFLGDITQLIPNNDDFYLYRLLLFHLYLLRNLIVP